MFKKYPKKLRINTSKIRKKIIKKCKKNTKKSKNSAQNASKLQKKCFFINFSSCEGIKSLRFIFGILAVF